MFCPMVLLISFSFNPREMILESSRGFLTLPRYCQICIIIEKCAIPGIHRVYPRYLGQNHQKYGLWQKITSFLVLQPKSTSLLSASQLFSISWYSTLVALCSIIRSSWLQITSCPGCSQESTFALSASLLHSCFPLPDHLSVCQPLAP